MGGFDARRTAPEAGAIPPFAPPEAHTGSGIVKNRVEIRPGVPGASFILPEKD